MYPLPNFPQRTIGQYHNWDFLDSQGPWEVPDLRRKKLQGIVCYLPLEGLSSVRTWRMWSLHQGSLAASDRSWCRFQVLPQISDLHEDTMGFPGCKTLPYLAPGSLRGWVPQPFSWISSNTVVDRSGSGITQPKAWFPVPHLLYGWPWPMIS